MILEISAARADLERLASELRRAAIEEERLHRATQSEAASDLRRFSRDLETANIQLLSEIGAQVSDKIRADGLAGELRRQQALTEQQLVADAELQRVRTELDVVHAKITGRERLLEGLRTRQAAAEERLARCRTVLKEQNEPRDVVLASSRWAIEAQRIRIEQLELERTRLMLEAPAGGLVDSVFKRAGEIVLSGQPVVRILGSQPSELVAWVPEADLLRVHIGDIIELIRLADGSRHRSHVLRVGGGIRRIPDRITGAPDMIAHGLPIIVACPDEIDVCPGEQFRVRGVATR